MEECDEFEYLGVRITKVGDIQHRKTKEELQLIC
jgi:hypothetical protein